MNVIDGQYFRLRMPKSRYREKMLLELKPIEYNKEIFSMALLTCKIVCLKEMITFPHADDKEALDLKSKFFAHYQT